MLASKTRKVTKPCLECGVDMVGVTVRREFCSPAHRQKHWLRRLYSLKPGEPRIYVSHRHEPRHTAGQDAPDAPDTPTRPD